MKVLGSVQEVAFDGKLIVRGSYAPAPRSKVWDNRHRAIGRVLRVFGPVSSPYITVEPSGEQSLLSIVGKQVYVEEVENHGKAKRRDR